MAGQREIQSESDLTKGASKESEEAQQQQQQQYHDIIEKTKQFEADHKECMRVLPYEDKSGQVYVQLYVFCCNNGRSEELKKSARKDFGKMGVGLEWTDLDKETSDGPNITPGVSRTLEKFEVDEISKIIDTSLLIFNKHRNITAVYPSLKVTNSKPTNEPCIMVNVIGKGRIPIGETDIPAFIGGFPVDIVEGFWIESYASSRPIEQQEQGDYLRLGASIGIKGVAAAGTLGAILKDDDGNDYLLSSHHVIGEGDTSEIIHPGLFHYLSSFLGKAAS